MWIDKEGDIFSMMDSFWMKKRCSFQNPQNISCFGREKVRFCEVNCVPEGLGWLVIKGSSSRRASPGDCSLHGADGPVVCPSYARRLPLDCPYEVNLTLANIF